MPRQRIDVQAPVHDQINAAIFSLVEANDGRHPEVVVYGQDLARVTAGITGTPSIETYNVDNLRPRLSMAAEFGRTNRNGQWSEVHPPNDILRSLLSLGRDQYRGLPVVERVTGIPIVVPTGEPDAEGRRRGTLLLEPGLHEEGGVYYQPDPAIETFNSSDFDISTQDVDAALDVLLGDLLGDFHFAEQASKANALALLLLPFVRDYIDGPTPLHAVLAPQRNSGKTILVQACLAPAFGTVDAGAEAESSAEWRKRITAELVWGSPVVFLDNLTEKLASGALSGVLTSGTWRDRVLGETRITSLKVRAIWAATGNNMQLGEDQIRRTTSIFLDPPRDHSMSEYRHTDLITWANAHRRDLVYHALVLVQHWLEGPWEHISAGYIFHRTGDAPVEGGLDKGSYQRWEAVMGGVLKMCDVDDFCGNQEHLIQQADPETLEEGNFLASWHEHAGSAALHLGEVVELCTLNGVLKEELPTELTSLHESDLRKKLSYWLRAHKGATLSGHVLRNDGARRLRWWVEPAA